MTPRQQLLIGLAPVSCGRRLHSAASQVGGDVGGRGASAGWSSSAGGAADLQLMAQHRSGVPLLPESARAKRDTSSPRTLPPRKPRRAVQRLPTWFIRIECGRCGKVRVLKRGAHDAAPYAASRHHRPHAPRRLRRPDRKSDAHAHSTTDGITATRDSGALSARRQRAVARRTMTGFYLTVDGRSADCHGERQFAIAELAGRPSTGAAPFGRCRARCGARMAVATACWRPGRNLADTRGCGRGGAVLGAEGAGVADDFAPAIA